MQRPTPETGAPVVPRLPRGLCLYAVGDIHGRLDCLEQVLERIAADRERHRPDTAITVFLGDYIDRGPNSAQVISRLMAQAAATPTILLAGNHERFLIEALTGAAPMRRWLAAGGGATLRSYGMELPDAELMAMDPEELIDLFADRLPEDHLQFFWSLPLHFTCGNVLFVHAGIRPDLPLSEQSPDDQTLIRDVFFAGSGQFPGLVIHGHTPQAFPEVIGNRINIDTGAFISGRLTCIALEDGATRFP